MEREDGREDPDAATELQKILDHGGMVLGERIAAAVRRLSTL